jgi:hypothetical protein
MVKAVSHPPTGAFSERVHVSGAEDTWPEPIFGQKVKVVCERCNNGWMSRIENHAIPLVAPMANGVTTRLRPREQARVAAWVALTAMVSQHLHPPADRFVPEAHYHQFLKIKQPLNTMTVWLGALSKPIPARVAKGMSYFTSASAMNLSEFVSVPNGAPEVLAKDVAEGKSLYVITMNVGPLLMFLLGHETPGVQGVVAPGAEASLQRIWPLSGHLRWPPVPIEALGSNTNLARHLGVGLAR